jgi:hypothetical protein
VLRTTWPLIEYRNRASLRRARLLEAKVSGTDQTSSCLHYAAFVRWRDAAHFTGQFGVGAWEKAWIPLGFSSPSGQTWTPVLALAFEAREVGV